MIRTLCTSIVLTLLLQACQTVQQEPSAEVADAGESSLSITVLSDAEVVTGAGNVVDRQRFIADTLFAALQALDADRLLTPIDDNAHARFMRVLAFDPDNEIALQGLQDIVVRYVELSEEAGRRGLFVEAEELLDRARFIDDEHPDIAKAWAFLQDEMNSGDLFFELDEREFANRSEAAQEKLTDIAHQARTHQAFFLITAPNDDLARWMYSVMRTAVEGYRLRGNIELASRTSVRLRLSTD